MKTRLFILFSALLLVFSVGSVHGQGSKFKALFIYNFTKYIDWPSSYKQGDFVIGVFGSSDITSELNVIANKKSVNNQKIVVKTYSSVGAIGKCHIFFLPQNKSGYIGSVLSKLSGQSTLIVTDKPGAIRQGSGINFIETGGSQGFEIKKSNIEAKGMKVSSNLLALGTVVN